MCFLCYLFAFLYPTQTREPPAIVIIFFHSYLRKIPILTTIFQTSGNVVWPVWQLQLILAHSLHKQWADVFLNDAPCERTPDLWEVATGVRDLPPVPKEWSLFILFWLRAELCIKNAIPHRECSISLYSTESKTPASLPDPPGKATRPHMVTLSATVSSSLLCGTSISGDCLWVYT